MHKTEQAKFRWYGIDLIRSFFMLLIINWHAHEAVFPDDSILFNGADSWSAKLEVYSHYFSFGGQVLILIFALLLGIKNSNLKKIFVFLLISVFVLALCEGRPFGEQIYYEWDIYSLLTFSVLFLWFCQSFKIPNWILGVFGFIVLVIPWWNIFPKSDGFFNAALVGTCPPEGTGAWPILPWAGLFLTFFSLGSFIRRKLFWFKIFTWREGLLWFFILALSIPHTGAYQASSATQKYYCDVLRQPIHVLASQLSWILFLLRLSFLEKINSWLAQQKGILTFSALRWNSSFGLCYLLQFIFLAIASRYAGLFLKHPHVFDAMIPTVILATELAARFMIFFQSKNLNVSRHEE